jgi:hypothetical protein
MTLNYGGAAEQMSQAIPSAKEMSVFKEENKSRLS